MFLPSIHNSCFLKQHHCNNFHLDCRLLLRKGQNCIGHSGTQMSIANLYIKHNHISLLRRFPGCCKFFLCCCWRKLVLAAKCIHYFGCMPRSCQSCNKGLSRCRLLKKLQYKSKCLLSIRNSCSLKQHHCSNCHPDCRLRRRKDHNCLLCSWHCRFWGMPRYSLRYRIARFPP